MFPVRIKRVPIYKFKAEQLDRRYVYAPYIPLYRTSPDIFFLDFPWRRRIYGFFTQRLYFWLGRLLRRSESYSLSFQDGSDPWNPFKWFLTKRVLIWRELPTKENPNA